MSGTDDRPRNLSPDEAQQQLRVGNDRYVADQPARPHGDASRRAEVAGGQQPFATIVACADSRVCPEIVFDQGMGDLFVLRVAGNIEDDAILGSIEYASLHLGVNLIVVMGHQSCGAVAATVDNVDVDGPATHSHIDALIDAIRPSVRRASDSGGDDLLEQSIRENAKAVAARIRMSEPVLAGLAARGVEVRPAYYNLETGKVDWLT